MNNLITEIELNELVERVSNYNIDGRKLELLDKLINSYEYYKQLSNKLQVKLDWFEETE